jgi:DNA polymerase-1
LKEVERALWNAAQMPLNPNSPTQLRKFFFEKMALRPKRLTKGGKSGNKQPAVDYDYLIELAEEGCGNPVAEEVAKTILRYRDLSKLLGTYVEGLGEAQDQYGRVHTKFNQDVARTGRLSSSNPNVQNIPRPDNDKFRIRKAFIAEGGNQLIVADYEQLEMRLLAWAAGEQDMIDIFLRGWDIHMGNASLVFGKPYEDIDRAKKVEKKVKAGELPPEEMTAYLTECLDDRQAAKAIGFG